MQQLTGLDAAFLYMETPTTYGHVSGLTIFDPSTASTGTVTLEDVKAVMQERLHLIPPARRRLVEVPFGLDHPYWIEDPDFDLDFHVRELALPRPGTAEQLAEQVARLVSRPLDRSRPLWELYLIQGLEDGHVAQLTKMHHSAIDGVSGAEILATLLDLVPDPPPVEPPERAWRSDRVPSEVELLNRSLLSLTMQPLKLLRFQRRALRTLGRQGGPLGTMVVGATPLLANLGALAVPLLSNVLSRGQRDRRPPEGEVLERPPTSAPRTSFNHVITPHRRIAFGTLSLDEVKAVKNAFGVTVNDVVMALCGGALRRWLVEHDELPEKPLLAMVPVSVRTEAERGALGNKVSAMIASLATDVADPVERLQAIHRAMDVAKEQHKAIPADLLADFAQFSSPALVARAARAMGRARIADLVNPPFNVVVSNVPGPGFPLFGLGARMVSSFPVSAINDGVGLNITVMSYMGNLDFGLVADRELVPDLWRMVDHLRSSLDELTKAASSRR